uniref:semaphorin-1A-like n=1 Tax=Styela clava TaxID=7725 RepID=UPI00193A880F|nr:semaphorin-1A-like [Styela clava]
MKPYFWISLRIATLVILFNHVGSSSFPENVAPISVTKLNDVSSSVFTGGDLSSDGLQYVQDIKMMKIAGKTVIAISAREKLFIVRTDDFSPTSDKKVLPANIFTWKSDEGAKGLCQMKGQSEENCDNYIRVLQPMDENGNKLLVCATNSFDPLCKYITATSKHGEIELIADEESFSGTEKCAFGPHQTGVSLYSGESLYSATVSEFSGRSYAISRSLGNSKQLRTPKFDSKFLNEPYFVKMVDDGPRVLIFMNEMVPSQVNGDIRMMAYVAQVCKNDVGGQHVLVRQWTKFEKTRLNCSVNGFYFDQLRDVSEPVDVHVGAGPKTETIKMIYATFTTPDHSVPGSAVCAFSLNAIHDALLGRFKDDKGTGDIKSTAPTGARHPGNCPSESYSESELLFLKSHPLLEDQARGSLLTTHVGESWSSVAVDSSAGPHKNWTVYFVGTSNGDLLRYLAPTSGIKTATLLRRQSVYDVNRCSGNLTRSSKIDETTKSVIHITLDPSRNQIFMTYKHCVITVAMRSCDVHRCKDSCLGSADPYCGWNGTKCVEYTSPSVNVEQYVHSNAINRVDDIASLCPQTDLPSNDKDGIKNGDSDSVTTTEKENEAPRKNNNKNNGDEANATNGTFIVSQNGDDGVYSQHKGTINEDSGFYIQWEIVLAIALACALLFFSIGFCCSKFCCTTPVTVLDTEKQQETIDASKGSIAVKDTLCKKAHSLLASISPKRKRKQPGHIPPRNISQSTLADPQNEPLVDSNKYDECVKQPRNSFCNDSVVSSKYIPNGRPGSRMTSVSSTSQVTTTESLASYGSKRRNSAQPGSSVSSMNTRGRHSYATAPRLGHSSSNRSSDPSEYSNASTLRADKVGASRLSSRHSTPVPQVTTPTFKDLQQFDFDLENTTHVLNDVERVILMEQQRRSQEMEAVPEEFDERARHDSSDSGKGSSPRNSMQNDDERANKVPTLPRPENLQLGQRGRKRLNSEPTSPTVPQPPLPPPSSHKPVSRSNSKRSQHSISVPNQHDRKRSESFSFQSQPSTPVGNNSPPRLVQAVMPMHQQGYQQSPPNIYATLPTNPRAANGKRLQMEPFNRQQSYDTYSPQNRYPTYDQRDNSNHPAMHLPDKYSSLPLRSQAHRSNKKPYVNGYMTQMSQPGQNNRHSSHSNGAPPQFHKQMSSPANFDQRLRYVPPPTVPAIKGYHSPLPEQNAV